jgi:archaellum biogenesis ATPase FlaH
MNNEQLSRFYKTLRARGPAGYEEIRAIPGDSRNGHRPTSQFYQNWQEIVADFERLRKLNEDGCHVFYSVCPRAEKRGTKDAVTAAGCLWMDSDFKSYSGGEAEARERLSQFKHEPNVIVHSGRGLHAYWLLREASNDLQRVEQINKAIAKELGGDNVSDVSRVMRLPGFMNVKVPANPVLAKLEQCQALLDYSLDDFNFLFNSERVLTASRHNNASVVTAKPLPVERVSLDSLGISREIADLIRDGAEVGHRSNAIAACVSALLDAGLDDEQITQIMLDPGHGIGQKAHEKPRPDEWIRDRVRAVRQWRAENPKPVATAQQSQAKEIRLISCESLMEDESLQLQPLVDDLIYRRAITLLAGAPGSGKSNLALCVMNDLASHAVTWLAKRNKSRTIYYSLEDPLAETRKRQLHHAELLKPDTKAIAFSTDAHGFDEMRKAIEQHRADLVIIDSLSVWQSQFNNDENDNLAATRLMAALRQLANEMNVAVLLVHHVAKPNANSPLGSQPIWSVFRGAGSFVAQSDIALVLRRENERFILEYAKNRLSMKSGRLELLGDENYGFSLADENARANGDVILSVVGDDERLIKEEIIERAQREGCSKNKALESLRLAVKNEYLFTEPNPRNRKQLIYRKRASDCLSARSQPPVQSKVDWFCL